MIIERMYVIRNNISKMEDYWLHDQGWIEDGFEQATRYSEKETKTFDLPFDGEWIMTDE